MSNLVNGSRLEPYSALSDLICLLELQPVRADSIIPRSALDVPELPPPGAYRFLSAHSGKKDEQIPRGRLVKACPDSQLIRRVKTAIVWQHLRV
jgi:hypothetical protein